MKSKIIQDKTSWKYLDWYFSKVGIAPHPPCPKLIDPKRMLVYLSGFQSLTEAVSHTSVGILSLFFFFFFMTDVTHLPNIWKNSVWNHKVL